MADSLSLSPVSVAVYALLNVGSLTTLASGGIHDDVPQNVSFPFVLYEVQEREFRGFGAGYLPEVTIRVHVYSLYEGFKQAQTILARAVELLKDQALTVVGYSMCGHVFYDNTVALPGQEINGQKCHELVASFRAYVEEA